MKTEEEVRDRIKELVMDLGGLARPFVGSRCINIDRDIDLLKWVLEEEDG